jgi:hypothetical protein
VRYGYRQQLPRLPVPAHPRGEVRCENAHSASPALAGVRHEVGTRNNVQISFDIEREEVRLNPVMETLVGRETVKKWARPDTPTRQLACRQAILPLRWPKRWATVPPA